MKHVRCSCLKGVTNNSHLYDHTLAKLLLCSNRGKFYTWVTLQLNLICQFFLKNCLTLRTGKKTGMLLLQKARLGTSSFLAVQILPNHMEFYFAQHTVFVNCEKPNVN